MDNYIILYMPTYAIRQLHLPQTLGFIATTVGGALLMVGAPYFGHLSDRIGRLRLMVVVCVLFAVSAIRFSCCWWRTRRSWASSASSAG